MRPVRGFDRPVLQWLFVAAGVLLMAVAIASAVALRRERRVIESLRAADLNARLERQRLELRVSQEQSAREAFALEAARARRSTAGVPEEPTLTLSPARTRGPVPPEPTVSAPAAAQPILLRLLLGTGRPDASRRYALSLRDWSGGGVRWSRSGLHATLVEGKPAVTARLTGDVLAPGAYEMLLTDVTGAPAEAGVYELSVREASAR